MAESFTPGPWVAVGAWVEHPDDDRADVCICDPLYFGQQQFGRSASEIIANARLIAATPDLLEALTLALPYVETAEYDEFYKPGSVAKVVKQMRAAIAKATGETP